MVIHGERRHLNDYAPIAGNFTGGSDFYTVEIVNATGDDLTLHPSIPSGYNMIATLMLISGFEPCFRMQGITDPIQIFTKRFKVWLGIHPNSI